MSRTAKRVIPPAVLFAAIVPWVLLSCRPYGHVPVRPADERPRTSTQPNQPKAGLKPIPRYGGTVLTAKRMPGERGKAYRWTKNMGTLVAYETFLRRYANGTDANHIRQQIRERFVPANEDWKEAWLLYSRLEIIDGAICDPTEGLILLGRPGKGRLPPFFYEDLIAALRCSVAGEKIGVTMSRIFPARFHELKDPKKHPYVAHETSVEFFSRKLWNTHLAYVLFEGDRMLKSLTAGFDIFRGEKIRASVPGFATVVEMAARRPAPQGTGTSKYGRVWIELTTVKINTTDARNVAIFSDVKLEVRAESKHVPLHKFAKHIRENYEEYAAEFPIFAEVERAARVVAIARWLVETYPSVASRLIDDSYEQVKVTVPQVIRARYDKTHDRTNKRGQLGLIGGVIFPSINKYKLAPKAKVSDTELAKVPLAVLKARPNDSVLAWHVPLGKQAKGKYIAWNVTGRNPTKGPAKANARNE